MKYPDDREKSNHRGMSPLSIGHHIKFAPPECEQKLCLYDVTYRKYKALNYTCTMWLPIYSVLSVPGIIRNNKLALALTNELFFKLLV